jgi:hypothetical protein
MGRPGSVYFVPDSYTYPPIGDKEYSARIKIISTGQTIVETIWDASLATSGASLVGEETWTSQVTQWTPPPSHEQGPGPAPPQGQGD